MTRKKLSPEKLKTLAKGLSDFLERVKETDSVGKEDIELFNSLLEDVDYKTYIDTYTFKYRMGINIKVKINQVMNRPDKVKRLVGKVTNIYLNKEDVTAMTLQEICMFAVTDYFNNQKNSVPVLLHVADFKKYNLPSLKIKVDCDPHDLFIYATGVELIKKRLFEKMDKVFLRVLKAYEFYLFKKKNSLHDMILEIKPVKKN